MIAALLGAEMIFALAYGRIDLCWNIILCAGVFLGVLLWRKSHKHHGDMASIDYQAQLSRLKKYSVGLKVIFAIVALVLCIASDSKAVALVIFVSMGGITIGIGGTKPSYYFSLMLIPVLFIILSGIAIVFEVGGQPLGYLDIPMFGGYVSITPQGQEQAFHVMIRAMGAVSCLYMISLSTPMSEIVGVLKKARLPSFIIELLYLIYRYIFIVMDMLCNMNTAARARLGYRGARAQFRTFLHIGGNLMVRSFQRARASFDAMEARCYDGKIAFLEVRRPIGPSQAVAAAVYLLAIGGLWILKAREVIP